MPELPAKRRAKTPPPDAWRCAKHLPCHAWAHRLMINKTYHPDTPPQPRTKNQAFEQHRL
uniref:Uncharacterized protein n=1 Tax=Conchiformibius kuhniae TaxID=211502 RepID=A0A8T9MVU0_9NEIS|nr:hypothetical protein LVJ77_09665 [Conchiformibius kuhniae]